MLLKGIDLTDRQRAQVLATYVQRWTHENARQTYGGRCPGCVQSGPFPGVLRGQPSDGRVWTEAEWHAYHVPLMSDAAWVAAHAFEFLKDGSRLSTRAHHARPAYRTEWARPVVPAAPAGTVRTAGTAVQGGRHE
jgi:hypothetical protein